jgi:hypothetical protein
MRQQQGMFFERTPTNAKYAAPEILAGKTKILSLDPWAYSLNNISHETLS